jgi:hypothetical protein
MKTGKKAKRPAIEMQIKFKGSARCAKQGKITRIQNTIGKPTLNKTRRDGPPTRKTQ